MVKIPELVVECQFILPTEQVEYNNFVSNLQAAGWIVEE